MALILKYVKRLAVSRSLRLTTIVCLSACGRPDSFKYQIDSEQKSTIANEAVNYADEAAFEASLVNSRNLAEYVYREESLAAARYRQDALEKREEADRLRTEASRYTGGDEELQRRVAADAAAKIAELAESIADEKKETADKAQGDLTAEEKLLTSYRAANEAKTIAATKAKAAKKAAEDAQKSADEKVKQAKKAADAVAEAKDKTAAKAKAATLTDDAKKAKADAQNKAQIAKKLGEEAEVAMKSYRQARGAIEGANRDYARKVAGSIEKVAFDLYNAKVHNAEVAANAKAAASAKSKADEGVERAKKALSEATANAKSKADALGTLNADAATKSTLKTEADARVNQASKIHVDAKSAAAPFIANFEKAKELSEATTSAKVEMDATAEEAAKALAEAKSNAEKKSLAAAKAESDLQKAEAAQTAAQKAAEEKKDDQGLQGKAKAASEKLKAASSKAAQAKKAAQAAVSAIAEKTRKANSATQAVKRADDAKTKADAHLKEVSAQAAPHQADVDNKAKELTAAKGEQARALTAKVAADKKVADAQKASQEAATQVQAKQSALVKSSAHAKEMSEVKSSADAKAAAGAEAERNAQAAQNKVASEDKAYAIPLSEAEKESKNMASFYRAALWGSDPKYRLWTDVTVALIRANLNRLSNAKDISDDYCPGYSEASQHHKEVCWLRIVGGIVWRESGYKPDDYYMEPNGIPSIGLMALSPKECKNYETEAHLKHPILNLVCGIGMMARLIERDGYIDGPKGSRGAGSYWSTVRAPYVVGERTFGFKKQISQKTATYRDF